MNMQMMNNNKHRRWRQFFVCPIQYTAESTAHVMQAKNNKFIPTRLLSFINYLLMLPMIHYIEQTI